MQLTDEVLERYVSGQLAEAEREAIEEHFFACELCFERVEILRATVAELKDMEASAAPAPARKRVAWKWWALAATGAAVVALALYLRPPQPAPPPERAAQAPASSTAAFARLAQVEAPPYQPLVLRKNVEEVDKQFQQAMASYQRGEYAAAVAGLQKAQESAPRRADIVFFLGASELLNGDAQGAVRDLQKTVALGDTPFLEDAHFYLAKAYLRRGDAASARAELDKVVALQGERAQQARELIEELKSVVRSQ